MSLDLKQMVSTVAPFLGSLIGGPLGAAAGKLVGQALLGKDNVDPGTLTEALAQATPEQLAELKRIDAEYQTKMAELNLDEVKVAATDRDSARKRETIVQDKIPAVLAMLLTMGFFSILLILMMYPVQREAQSVVEVMLGALGTAWIASINYYFGSSSGSQLKTHLMNGKQI